MQVIGAYTTFSQEGGIRVQHYRDSYGMCITMLFKSMGVRSPYDSPESICNMSGQMRDLAC